MVHRRAGGEVQGGRDGNGRRWCNAKYQMKTATRREGRREQLGSTEQQPGLRERDDESRIENKSPYWRREGAWQRGDRPIYGDHRSPLQPYLVLCMCIPRGHRRRTNQDDREPQP